MTPDLLKKLSVDSNVTLIRGLRNGKDLDYEVNQLRFMEEMYPSINVCFLQCERQYDHISSSAIRKISAMGDSSFSSKYTVS